METKSVLLVGVGGQGAILTAKVLVNGLMKAGYDVKMSEVHGMSQRGGSVSTQVRWGDKVYSPVVDKGEADAIVSFELLEAARYVEYLKPDGKIVVNTQTIDPMPAPDKTSGLDPSRQFRWLDAQRNGLCGRDEAVVVYGGFVYGVPMRHANSITKVYNFWQSEL